LLRLTTAIFWLKANKFIFNMPQGNQIQGNKNKKKVMFFKFLWVFCFNKKNKGLDIKEHKQQIYNIQSELQSW